ncbi:MAG: hypothetical protein D6805_10320 [Planctomycetota bacterium]|nr:MAG: hypothetical protein D6805_10320 [Planctomycetota bacterium]
MNFSDYEKQFQQACENVEPKSWPYTHREAGAFLLPIVDDLPSLTLLVRSDPVPLSSLIYLPGGIRCTPSPQSTMYENVEKDIGLQPKDIRLYGYLGLYPLHNLEFDAHIYLGTVPSPEKWDIDPDTVDQIYKVPLETLMDEFRANYFDLKRPEFHLHVDEEVFTVSDATAAILCLLLRRISIASDLGYGKRLPFLSR